MLSSICAYPYSYSFHHDETALLVIDAQVDFLSPNGYYASMGADVGILRRVVPNINSLIKIAHSCDIRVIFTRQGYRSDRTDMTRKEYRRHESEASVSLIRGNAGFQIDPAIDFGESDILVDKTCNSAFVFTDLDHILRCQGISNLIFSGFTSEVCVQSTLRSACDLNYNCLTVSDCCASSSTYFHEASMKMIVTEDGLFGSTTTLNDVKEALPIDI